MFNLKNRLIEKLNGMIDARIETHITPINDSIAKYHKQDLIETLNFRHQMKEHGQQVEGYLKGFNKLVNVLVERDKDAD